MRLSDTIDQFGVKSPESRLQVLCALMYGEASQAGMSLRQLAEFSVHVWQEQARHVEAAVTAHNLIANAQNSSGGK